MQVLVAKRVREKIQEYFQRPSQNYRFASTYLNGVLHAIATNNNERSVEFGNIGLPNTNKGETRIENCVKYHIGYQRANRDGSDYFRVVTIELKEINTIVVAFFGDHDETENWINRNIGYKIIVREIGNGIFFEEVLMTGLVKLELENSPIQGKLFRYIQNIWENKIKNKLTDAQINRWENIDANISTDHLELLTESLVNCDDDFKKMLFDAFMILRSGEIKKAIIRIRLYFDENFKEPNNLHNQDIRRNDSFINLRALSNDELDQFMNLDYDDVIVYLHPDQEKYTKEEFSSPVRISGVSGSGKTSILLNRAVNLAVKYLNEKNPDVLVLTLQTSLTQLLQHGINRIVETRFGKNSLILEQVKKNIKVKSLWQLMSELILDRISGLKREDKFVLERRLNELIHQGRIIRDKPESLEEIWEIFYNYPLISYPVSANNEHLFKIHQYILAKGVNPSKYIKDEFDYIRSFLKVDEFHKYLDEPRRNRLFGIERGAENKNTEANRYAILEGLKNWQEFTRFNGITDYPELAIILLDLIQRDPINNALNPIFRSILIDESQDLGTNELSILRSLVELNPNDLFMVGDFAQKIHVKKINFSDANVNVSKHFKLTQNYRNSAEILIAADKVLKYNWKSSLNEHLNDDILISDAEFSNMHSGNVNIIKCDSFIQELICAINYIKDEALNNKKNKYCLVVCGFSKISIQNLKNNNSILHQFIVLNTIINYRNTNLVTNILNEQFFISDLDHCKGFEFDSVIIINANSKVIPSNKFIDLIENENNSNDEISKFYVAMTRAKSNLIISYSDKLTEFIDIPDRDLYFNQTVWNQKYISSNIKIEYSNKIPNTNPVWEYTGRDFLFTPYAIGLSKDGQDKLVKVVNGKRVDIRIGQRTIPTNFKDIKSLYSYMTNSRNYINVNKLFGVNLEEIKKCIEGLNI